jgi:hypothetical protein
MLIKEKSSILSSKITDEAVFLNRRKLIKAAAGISIASLLPASVSAQVKKYAQVPVGPYSGVFNGHWYHPKDSSINVGRSPWIAKFNASVALTPCLMQVEI